MQKIIPEIHKIKNNDDLYTATELAIRHHELINELISLSQLDGLAKEIEDHPRFGRLFETYTYQCKNGEDVLEVGLKKFSNLGDWPLWLRIRACNESSIIDSRMIMWVCFSKLPKIHHKYFYKMLKNSFSKNVKDDQKNVTFKRQDNIKICFSEMLPYLELLEKIDRDVS